MTIKERDRLRARRLMHYVDKSVAESAKVAERERRGRVMRNETGELAPKSGVFANAVKDTGWNGVPQGIPSNKYPNNPRKRSVYRDKPVAQPERAPLEQSLIVQSVPPVSIAQRASDARGRAEGQIPQYGIRPWKLHELPDVVTAGIPDRS